MSPTLSTASDGWLCTSINYTHRFNRAALDQGSQSDGTPEYASPRVHGELIPAAKRVGDCDGIGLPGPTTTNPGSCFSSRRGGQHDLHHCSADVTARTTRNRASMCRPLAGGAGRCVVHENTPTINLFTLLRLISKASCMPPSAYAHL